MMKEVTGEQFEEIKSLMSAAVTLSELRKKPGFSLQQKITLTRAQKMCSEAALKIGE